MLLAQFTQQWWMIAARGVLALIFGVAAFLWPGITLAALIALFGAYVLIDGVASLSAAVHSVGNRERFVPLLAEGLLGIIAGAFAFVFPAVTALGWVLVVAAWAIATGVLGLVAALRLRKHVSDEIFLGLSGFVSIVLGLAFAAFPAAGLLAWTWLLGAYAIVFGVLMIALAFRLHAFSRELSRLEQIVTA